MENDLERLEKEADNLQKKIDKSRDYFFIYGWSRKLEEIKNRIEKLKNA